MAKLTTIALFLLPFGIANVYSNHTSTNASGHATSGRAASGQQYVEGQFLFQVGLVTTLGVNLFCSGTILAQNIILTAAHCCYPYRFYPHSISIKAGSYFWRVNANDTYHAKSVHIHSRYKPDKQANDIAIIKIWDFLNYTPVALPISDGLTKSGTFLTVSGWGTRRLDAQDPQAILTFGQVITVNRTECEKILLSLNSTIENNVQCTLGSVRQLARMDTCSGDSGGPLIRFYPAPKPPIIVGIIITGLECSTSNVAVIYTNVYAFLNWIKKRMTKLTPIDILPNNSLRRFFEHNVAFNSYKIETDVNLRGKSSKMTGRLLSLFIVLAFISQL